MRRQRDTSKLVHLFIVIDEVLIVLTSLLAIAFLYKGVTSSTAISNQSNRSVFSPTQTPALIGTLTNPTASSTTQSSALKPGDWPRYLLNNTSYNPDETSITAGTVSQLRLFWTAHAQGGVTAQPVVVENMVYWGSWDGYERATTLSGQQRWSTYLGGTRDSDDGCDPDSAGVASTATIAPLTIKGENMLVDLVGGGDAAFYALNASTGRILWKTVLGNSPAVFLWDAPVLYGGNIYIGVSSFGDCPSVQGKLFQINAATGQVRTVFNIVPEGCLGGTQWGSPTIDEDTGNLYIATGNLGRCGSHEPYAMALVELRASDLRVLDSWQVPASDAVSDGDFGSTPVLFSATANGVTRRMVGAVNKNGIYYAFDRGALSKGPVWQARIATGPVCAECDGAGTIAPSAWDGTRLYIGGGNTTINGKYCEGSLRALDPADGHFIWEHCLGDARALAALAVVPGVVVVGEGHFVTAVEAETGAALFVFQDSGSGSIFDGAPSITHGMLLIGNMDGTLYAFAYHHTSARLPASD